MIAYCGIDCSKCDSYLATQPGNHEELETVAKKLSELYHTEVKPEYVICDGCRVGKDAPITAPIYVKCPNAALKRNTTPASSVPISHARNCSSNWTTCRIQEPTWKN